MIFDYDPRLKRESPSSKSSPRRLLEDIITEQIVATLASSTASNYITTAYGSNHRILYEGIARLLSSFIVDSMDNVEDMEISQLRADYIASRYLYFLFPDEEKAPQTNDDQDLLRILVQTYQSLLLGATQSSVSSALSSVEHSSLTNAEIEGYVTSITSSILALTEENEDGVVAAHKHYAYANPVGRGATDRPQGARWGDAAHQHEIRDGVVQPYTDSEGNTHTHEVYFGLPDYVVSLQHNLRSVFDVLKPAHLKTGSVSSILQEVGTIQPLAEDTFTDALSLGLGVLHQEDMRKARSGVWENRQYAHAQNRQIRVSQTNLKPSDNLILSWISEGQIVTQRVRVLSVALETPEDYSLGQRDITFIRDLNTSSNIFSQNFTLTSGLLEPFSGAGLPYEHPASEGEPVLYEGSVYYVKEMGYRGDDTSPIEGSLYKIQTYVIEVDSKIKTTGLVLVDNISSSWTTSLPTQTTTTIFPNTSIDPLVIHLPDFIRSQLRSSLLGLPTTGADFITSVTRGGVETTITGLFYDPRSNTLTSPTPVFQEGDVVSVEYPSSQENQRTFTELNNPNQTLNAARPTAAVSLSGRGNTKASTPAPYKATSYTLNAVSITTPYTTTIRQRTYQVSTSDLLNSINQTLNSSFKLNNAKLGLDANPDKIFAPAEATLTTSRTTIPFVDLGFEPQYLTSVQDDQGNDIPFTLGTHTVSISITQETTITFIGLSNKPLNEDQAWLQGDTYVEGVAPLKYTSTSSLPNVSEYPSENYINNPLGLGVSEDEDRRLVVNRTSVSVGQKGEMRFFEDLFSRIDLKGSGQGFLDDLRRGFQDDLMYADPSLYILGPLATTETSTLATIPTYLFFNYQFLNTFGGDGHYVSLYRVSPSGIKYYQTFTPLQNSSGFTALQPLEPAPNGTPLAYQLLDEGLGGGFSVSYSNGDFSNNYLAEPTASFNHIPNETYYLEVYMEEDGGGADSMYFFSSGNSNPTQLGTSWDTSPDTYRLDDPFGAIGVTYIYEVTFATNPGEVVSFQLVNDPNPTASKLSEEVGVEAVYETSSYAESERLYGVRILGSDTPILKTFNAPWQEVVVSHTPSPIDTSLTEYGLSKESSLPKLTDTSETSLLLLPATISEEVIRTDDHVSVSILLSTSQISTSPLVTDSVLLSSQKILSENVTSMTDEADFILSLSRDVESNLPSVDDQVVMEFFVDPQEPSATITDDVSFALSLSVEVTDSVNKVTDLVDAGSFLESDVQATNPTLTDQLSAYISSVYSVESVPSVSDTLTTHFSLTPSGAIPSTTDEVSTSLSLIVDLSSDLDVVSDDYTKSLLLVPASVEEDITLSDSVSVGLTLTPKENMANVQDHVAYALIYNVESVYPLITDGSSGGVVGDSSYTESVPSTTDETSYLLRLTSTNMASVPVVSDVATTSLSVLVADQVSLSDSAETSLFLTKSSESVTPPLSDEHTALIQTQQSLQDLSPIITDEVSPSLRLTITETTPAPSDEVTTQKTLVNPYVYIGFKYNESSYPDEESISIYEGSMDTLSYPEVVSLTPDINGLNPIDIVVGESGDKTLQPSLLSAYANTGADAIVRLGPLEWDKWYDVYAPTKYDENSADFEAAFEIGGSSESPYNYMTKANYEEIFPGSEDFLPAYHIHRISPDFLTQKVKFAFEAKQYFNFTKNQDVRLYFHIKYIFTDAGDTNDLMRLRQAPDKATPALPNGSDGSNDTSGWIEPLVHDGAWLWDPNTLSVQFPNSTKLNADNDSQFSWRLQLGTRYHLQVEAQDDARDIEVFLDTRSDDNGASATTEYTSASSLVYTELLTQEDNQITQRNVFFTIRQDGFIIWEG